MYKVKTQLPDGPALITLKPGIKQPDAANTMLFSAARQITEDQIFVAGPGSIPTALWAARQGATITSWTDNINYDACIKDTFSSAKLAEPHIIMQAGFDAVETQFCDCALLHLPRGKDRQYEMIQLAAAVLKPRGRLVFVGAKKEGVKGALKYIKELFGYGGIVTQKSGYHAGLSQCPERKFELPQLTYKQNLITIEGEPTYLISCTGVFAAGRLDGGAKALIDSMFHSKGNSVLDMGCGTGLVGLSAVRKGANVIFTDVSARAVESTRKTLHINKLSGTVIHSSGAELCTPGIFDVVYVNPPFHQGHSRDFETVQYLLKQAFLALKYGGHLYLVANTFLKYEAWIRETFSNVSTHYESKQYKVWHGIK
jgi:16S rRNA (guanine1207-N2)-methyltransferase